VCNYDWL